MLRLAATAYGSGTLTYASSTSSALDGESFWGSISAPAIERIAKCAHRTPLKGGSAPYGSRQRPAR